MMIGSFKFLLFLFLSVLSGCSSDTYPVEDFASKELNKEEEHIFPSPRELFDIRYKKIFSTTKTTLHDEINPPPTTAFPSTPLINPVTTPVTVPSSNPTPTIVTVPSTNPGNVTPTNPATTPVTCPSTTPITVPSTNPVTPPTTIPVTNPGTVPMAPPITNPVTMPPSGIPVTIPTTPPPVINPITPPSVPNAPTVSGQIWCVAKTGVADKELQAALDYACGIGGADCSTIQQTGSCYNPNTLQNHASYAFNSYYQKNPVPTSCDFGGTAMVVKTNPSTGSCVYPSSASQSSPSSSTTSSSGAATGSSNSSPLVLNSGYPASDTTTIFGSQPPPAPAASVSTATGLQPLFCSIILVMLIVVGKLLKGM